MFPLNQDTFVEHSGNTANDLYDDGSGYIYMMKEGRGRSDSGGNFLMSKQLDNWYFELNTLMEDGTSLYQDDQYHGRDIDQQKNVIYLRPVVAWSPTDEFTVSAGMESNVINNAYGYTNNQGQFIDQSGRTGYGLTMTWNGLKNDPDNGVVINANTAYLVDADNEQDLPQELTYCGNASSWVISTPIIRLMTMRAWCATTTAGLTMKGRMIFIPSTRRISSRML